MSTSHDGSFSRHWKEIAGAFLKTGAMSYGGPAIVGLMQAEFLERRKWLVPERFLEVLSLANLPPGAGTLLGAVRARLAAFGVLRGAL